MAEGTFGEHDLSLLSAYLDGELSQAERTWLEARLGREPALQAELESLRETVALVRSLPELRPPRSFTLDPAIYGRRAPGARWFALATPLIASGASLMVVAACAGILLLRGVGFGAQQLAAPAAAPAAEEARDLGQSEAGLEQEPPAPQGPFEEAPVQADTIEESEEEQEETAAAEIASEPQATPGIGLAAPAPPAEGEALSGEDANGGVRAAEPESGGLGGGGPAEAAPPVGQALAPTASPLPAPTSTYSGVEATEVAELPPPGDVEAQPETPAQEQEFRAPPPYFLVGVVIGAVAVLGVLLFSLGLGLTLARRRI